MENERQSVGAPDGRNGDSLRFVLQGIDHVALAVRDVTLSVRWYLDVLGLERRYQHAWGDHPAVVGTGTTSIALFPVEGGASHPPPGRNVITMRHVAFRADFENFTRAMRELDLRQIPFEFQHHDIAQSIYLRDPDGYEIEITTYDVKHRVGQSAQVP